MSGYGSDNNTFTCRVLDNDRDLSVKIAHNGKSVSLPRSQITRMDIGEHGLATITIPDWLYRNEFEPNRPPPRRTIARSPS